MQNIAKKISQIENNKRNGAEIVLSYSISFRSVIVYTFAHWILDSYSLY